MIAMDAVEMKDAAKEKLTHDLRALVSGAEDLLKVTAANAGAEYAAAKQKLERNLVSARDQLDHMEHVALLKAKHAARATDNYVHENPWQSIGVGAALGLVIGVLIGRR
jgi:ElaB/YqjD/DUF883 family membrane-anchored ribosome-binding protein